MRNNYSVVPALDLPGDLSFEQWVELGYELGRAEGQLQWAIGDWWAHGEHHYGQRKEVVDGADWQGPAFSTCADCASVARKFETSRRREVLSFTHHREVASFPPAEADALLDWCEEPLRGGGKRPRSARDLRVRKSEIAAEDEAAFRAKLPSIRYGPVLVPAKEITILVEYHRADSPARPSARPELDTSAAAGPVPDQLRDLQVEPEPVAFDRVAVARAALANLSFDETAQIVAEWFQTLSAEERRQVRNHRLDR